MNHLLLGHFHAAFQYQRHFNTVSCRRNDLGRSALELQLPKTGEDEARLRTTAMTINMSLACSLLFIRRRELSLSPREIRSSARRMVSIATTVIPAEFRYSAPTRVAGEVTILDIIKGKREPSAKTPEFEAHKGIVATKMVTIGNREGRYKLSSKLGLPESLKINPLWSLSNYEASRPAGRRPLCMQSSTQDSKLHGMSTNIDIDRARARSATT